MAELDPQQVDQLNESLRRVAESLELNSELLSRSGKKMAMDSKDMDALGVAVKRTGAGFGELTEAQKAARKAEDEAAKAAYNARAAAQSTVQTFKNLSSAMMDTEKNFKKYSNALSSAGDAAVSLGKTFGTMGTVIGYAVKGLTKVSEAYLTQADNVLKASDTIVKFSGAGARSTSQLLDMAHATGLTSKNLELLTKPLSGLGQGLISLGGTAGSGVNEFAKLTKILPETRAEYQRLGISQGELIENQAQYIKLQQLSGITLAKSDKTSGALQKASLQYTENLLELAAISGKNVEEIKKNQEIERTRYEIMIRNNLQTQEAIRLEKLGTEESKVRAAQIRQEMAARFEFLDDIKTTIGSEELNAAMSKFLSTGVVSKELAALKVQGVNIEKYAAEIKAGRDAKAVAADFKAELITATDNMARRVGDSVIHNMEGGKAVGLADKQIMQFVAANRNVDQMLQRKTVGDQLGDAKKPGRDTAQDARAKLTNLEIEAQVTMDKLLKATNPLIEGFNKNTVAALALYAAATAAALALVKMAGAASMNAVGNLAGRLPGTGGTVPPRTPPGGAAGARGALGRLGSRALGVLGPVGAVAGAGLAGYEVGSAINSSLGISDKIVDMLRSGADKDLEARITSPTRIAPKPQIAKPKEPDLGGTLPATATTNKSGQAASAKSILDFISKYESRGDYNILVGGKRAGLTDMTLAQVLDLQRGMSPRTGFESSAVGKYQIIRSTLQGLIAQTNLSLDRKFDSSTQDILGEQLLKNRGYEKFAQRKMDVESYADNLSKEWASLPYRTGKSFYAGVGSNASHVSRADLVSAIQAAEGGITKGPKSGYPATLHGTEVITPLEPNSILEKLAKTPADDSTKPQSVVNIEQTMREMNKMHAEMMGLFERKLDDMIAELETSNSTQEQLLKHSRT